MGSVSPIQKLPNILIPDHIGFWTANTIITLPARTTSEALPAAFATQVHYRLPLEQGTPLTPFPIVPYASLLISSLGWLRCWKLLCLGRAVQRKVHKLVLDLLHSLKGILSVDRHVRFCVYQIGISEAGCVTKILAYEEV
ncbi:hypothetical protein NC651_026657 [Populus alba x Populus x berolinensis]|nr:hypothetical protein NC651_026657 [Populus alba x Populus x berolinensis]